MNISVSLKGKVIVISRVNRHRVSHLLLIKLQRERILMRIKSKNKIIIIFNHKEVK